jgi:hypothetical protein
MEVRYQLRYSPVNRIYVPPETRDSIPAASTSSHQPAPAGQGGAQPRPNPPWRPGARLIPTRPVRQARDDAPAGPGLCGRPELVGCFLIKMA